MKIHFFIPIIFLINFSCNKNSTAKSTNAVTTEFIKISFHPSFHKPAETIINLKEKYLIFYSPSAWLIESIPTPQKNQKNYDEEKREYEKYIYERTEFIPFRANLDENDVENLNRMVNSFTQKDFYDKNNEPGIDGMSTNIVVSKSDGKLFVVNPANNPKPMQRKLYQQVLNILIEKNKNKNDSIILQKIQDYH